MSSTVSLVKTVLESKVPDSAVAAVGVAVAVTTVAAALLLEVGAAKVVGRSDNERSWDVFVALLEDDSNVDEL